MTPITVWAYVVVSIIPYVLVGVSDRVTQAPEGQGVFWALLSLILLYKLVHESRIAWGILLALDLLALAMAVVSTPAPLQWEAGAFLVIIASAVFLLLAPPTRRFVH